MYKWRIDGLQPGDPTDTNSGQAYFGAQQLFSNVGDITENLKVEYNAQSDGDLTFSLLKYLLEQRNA